MSSDVFAVIQADGSLAEIFPGETFTSQTVIIGSDAEVAWTLGVQPGDWAVCEAQHGPLWLATYDAPAFARYRILRAPRPAAPAGQQAVSHTLSLAADGSLVVSLDLEPAPAPPELTRFQFLIELADRPWPGRDAPANLVSAIVAGLADANTPASWAAVWADDGPVSRADPAALGLLSLAGLTANSDLDDFFRAAAAR